MIGLAQFAPFLLLILWAGHAADHYPRRRIVTLCFVTQLLCGALLFGLTKSGLHSVWPVFAVLALFGSARAFMMPATQAILVNLVPPQSFSRAVALSSSSFHVAVIAGPALCGLLYNFAGPEFVYGVVALLLTISVLLMWCTHMPSPPPSKEPATLKTVLEGMHFVRKQPILLGALSLDLFAVLFGGVTALLPAYVHEVLHAGPTTLGFLRAMPGVGAALTSVYLGFRPIERKVGPSMFAGVFLYGIATLVIGFTSSFWLALICLFLLGAGDMVSVFVRHLLVQLVTPDAIRGRVSAVSAVFIGASNELGEFESGVTAGWMGLVPAIIFGGAATLVVTSMWMLLFPKLSKMDEFPEKAKD
ncbi:MAG: MFS transporter, partial [Burkholderiales bacterium]|nr:MFS transporter [Burkholderiales bacterium]